MSIYRAWVTALPLMSAVLVGCSSPESNNVKTGAQSDSLAAQTDVATWLATVDHGDKPGNGYELLVRDGRAIGGKFYLLHPDKPHDITSPGQTATFEDLRVEGEKITFSITLATGDGQFHGTMTITLLDALTGSVGTKVRASVQSNAPNSASEELQFIRKK